MFTMNLTSVKKAQTNNNEEIDRYLLRIAAGDQDALSALYRATSASIYGFSLSILKNTHDAEDVLQDCFVHVYHSAVTYVSEGKPLAWMITIARNLCLQKLREHGRYSVLPEEDWAPYLSSQEGISAEDKLVLKECMQTLNDEERQIVVLHAVSGFKHREIASTLELPLSTVLSKYARAIRKLQNALQKGE